MLKNRTPLLRSCSFMTPMRGVKAQGLCLAQPGARGYVCQHFQVASLGNGHVAVAQHDLSTVGARLGLNISWDLEAFYAAK